MARDPAGSLAHAAAPRTSPHEATPGEEMNGTWGSLNPTTARKRRFGGRARRKRERSPARFEAEVVLVAFPAWKSYSAPEGERNMRAPQLARKPCAGKELWSPTRHRSRTRAVKHGRL